MVLVGFLQPRSGLFQSQKSAFHFGDARDEAKVEANKIVNSARTEIQAQKASAMATVKKDTGTLALTIAEKLIKKQLMGNAENQSFADGLINDIKLN